MKTITNITKVILVLFLVGSCTPEEDRNHLGETLDPSELDFSITQLEDKDYLIVVENQTPNITPYWKHENGSSNKNNDTLSLLFAGEHKVTFTAYTAGGAVSADPLTFTVTQDDPQTYTDSLWVALTGGPGNKKTWLLDLNAEGVSKYWKSPVYFSGKDLGWEYSCLTENEDLCWVYEPNWAGGDTWVAEAGDYGTMTFSLVEGEELSVEVNHAFTTDRGLEQGTFFLDRNTKTLRMTNAAPLQNSWAVNDVGDWDNFRVISLTEDAMQIGAFHNSKDELMIFNYVSKDYYDNGGINQSEPISPDAQNAVWSTDETWGNWINSGYVLYNNIWGEVEQSEQTMWANSYNDWGVWADHPETDGIKSYPNSSREVNIPIDDLGGVSSSFDIRVPSAGHYVAAYDIWCDDADNAPGDDVNNYEIMLWMNNRGAKPISYEWTGNGDPIPVATEVTLGDHTWNVYNGTNGNNKVFSFVRTENTSAATVDILEILQWLQERSQQEDNWFDSEGVYLTAVQFGYEITASPGGLNFYTDDYSVTYHN